MGMPTFGASLVFTHLVISFHSWRKTTPLCTRWAPAQGRREGCHQVLPLTPFTTTSLHVCLSLLLHCGRSLEGTFSPWPSLWTSTSLHTSLSFCHACIWTHRHVFLLFHFFLHAHTSHTPAFDMNIYTPQTFSHTLSVPGVSLHTLTHTYVPLHLLWHLLSLHNTIQTFSSALHHFLLQTLSNSLSLFVMQVCTTRFLSHLGLTVCLSRGYTNSRTITHLFHMQAGPPKLSLSPVTPFLHTAHILFLRGCSVQHLSLSHLSGGAVAHYREFYTDTHTASTGAYLISRRCHSSAFDLPPSFSPHAHAYHGQTPEWDTW